MSSNSKAAGDRQKKKRRRREEDGAARERERKRERERERERREESGRMVSPLEGPSSSSSCWPSVIQSVLLKDGRVKTSFNDGKENTQQRRKTLLLL